jgi:hypothetical protein
MVSLSSSPVRQLHPATTVANRTTNSAICLSTLHAPSPPEPVALTTTNDTLPEAAVKPSIDSAIPELEAILKLQVCGHEFHAECLVSWFVLRKTSCPICRAIYYSKEAMEELEEAVAPQEVLEVASPPPPPVSNWRYFIHGRDVFRSQRQANVQTGTR